MKNAPSVARISTERPRQRPGAEPRPAAAGFSETGPLARDLRAAVRGEVRFDDGSRGLYATDASNYRQVPIGVVVPRDADDIVGAVDVCRRHGVPVLARGGGTSLAGQCCNVAVVFDCSKYMHEILDLDLERRQARVQPGLVLDDLRHKTWPHGLTFAPDPSTHRQCTLGGMIGNNSCGIHSVMGGKTDVNVEELEILTYDGLRMRVGATGDGELERIIREGGRRGEIYARLRDLRDRYADLIRARFPRIPRRVSGYALDQLLPENGFHVARALVGTEGTCAITLEATLRLLPWPPVRSLLVLGYPDVYSAADHVMEVLEFQPIGLEGLDDRLIEDMKKSRIHPENVRLLPEGNGWLLVEFGGETKAESDARARRLMDHLKRQRSAPSMKLFDDPEEEHTVWLVRESGLGATAHVPDEKDTWEGWEDSAVPPERLGGYLRDLRALMDRYHYLCALYGHFGQGCVHTRIDFDLATRAGIDAFRAFLGDAADLVVRYGGSLSGEHGDGQSRAELLPKMYGDEIVRAFREFKAIWDPQGRMNPHKVVDPYRITENLRLGTNYRPPEPRTHFYFLGDRGSFTKAAGLRCVGVGNCRKTTGGTMCPSYMATREEMHSTRGRARLLFEMLQGDPVSGGWRDEHVREALDLCLSCKGCKGECPVRVDMATYKAEFLSHYYEGRLRPASAYAFGLIPFWAPLASRYAVLANFVTQVRVFADVAKALAGIAPARRIPPLARRSFVEWFHARPALDHGGTPVVLWPDTFNNYFLPETARAAVEVLEAAGYRVIVPRQHLCCGRPLYDYGMLGLARGLLAQTLQALRSEIAEGVPLVGLEPSCVSVFRDELRELFPFDEDARRLSQQTFLLSEFLRHKVPDYRPPQLRRVAVVHGHCHHKAVLRWDAEEQLLRQMGLEMRALDSGCCGMAGGFGFEKPHYDVSMACGERVLLPAVRSAPRDALIVADGFSCREQISQATGRRALHLAQVLQMAMREGPTGPRGTLPEQYYVREPVAGGASPAWLAAIGAGLAAAGAAGAWMVARRRSRGSP
jgi:FAD/FMN-containing dehydrogenase/Fe-S oxidoreductase